MSPVCDDRAVSVTVSYTLTLMIATLLIGGLLMSTGGLLETQTERALYEELDVVGQTLAANLMSADRLVTVSQHDADEISGFDTDEIDVQVESVLPDRVAGTSYTIHVRAGNESELGELTLRSQSPEIEVTVPFVAKHIAEEYDERLRGGDVEIYTVNGTLEVRNS